MTQIEKRVSLVDLEQRTVEGQREMAAARAEVRVGHLLKKAFRVTGLSQKTLAERLGVTEGRVSQVLNADGALRVATAARYLRAMGYLLELEAEPADDGAPSLKAKRARDRRHKELFAFVQSEDTGATSNAVLITESDSIAAVEMAKMVPVVDASVFGNVRNANIGGTHYSLTKSPLSGRSVS
ncbi:helix-turn-helix transcriptional regulator [Leucobacter sp. NPDC077196]|uniref:helix-turn-helix domain-containing protein n=1 Tax=Leucobacter sp. NPDC077196 TaxID=3154959 RepID=UPI0034410FB4